jgi:alginate O-acetyltransferase complex protein AlgI
MVNYLSFNSYQFMFVFLPVAVAGYWLLRTTRFANWWLAAVSLYFYVTAGLIYLVPLLFTCFFDFYVGQKLVTPMSSGARKSLFIASVGIQLFILSVCKYLGWLTGSFNQLTTLCGLNVSIPVLTMILPPGISFYTFHTISYTADIYRGKFKPHNSIIDYITFVAFFPQLVAGPIARASELLPQFATKRPVITWRQAEIATWLICWGLFKKITLADNFGHLVSLIEPHMQPGSVATGAGLLFSYAFAGQIYCDFSAYTDIARGVGKLFNIELPRNFATPYFAASPAEFWRRWHISLSTWLRDYLYIPLGGERQGRLKTLRNLGITMFLGGLWHGAGIGYIVWGLYHGLLLVIYRMAGADRYLGDGCAPRLIKVAAIFLLFQLVCIGWIFFRATAAEIEPAFASIIGWSSHADWNFIHVILWGMTIYALPVVLTELLGYLRGCEFVDLYEKWHWLPRAFVYVAIYYAIVLFGARQQNEFIYFQF